MGEFWLDQLKGERAGVVDHFSKDVVTLGRNDEADLLYDKAGVSWDHAEIRFRDGDWWLIDSGSTNGSYVNDERAHNARLAKGDVIRLGKKGPVMRFLLSAPAKSESSGVAPKAPPPRPSAKKKRKASEPEIQIPDLSAPVRPGEGHSNLEPAPLPSARANPLPLVILGGLAVVSMLLLGFLYTEYDALAADLADVRGRATEAESKLRDAQAARDEAVRHAELSAEERFGGALEKAEREKERVTRRLAKAEERGKELSQRLRTLSAELEATRREGASGEDGRRTWKDIERSLRGSVVMIACVMEGVDRDGKRVQLNGFGTGFFASSQGHIVTNKHVVQPYKFREMALRIAREGIEIDRSSYQLHAWRGGTRFLRKKADGHGYELDPSTGYSTQLGTLELVRTAPDAWKMVSGEDAVQKIQIHAQRGNGDLAILRADAKRVIPIPAGRSSRVEKLDPVLVLGFPAGPQVLQKGIAETSPALGNVRKPESTIDVSAPMIPGNSGGPLIDRDGRVIGVCTQVVKGTETLGSCIRIEHAMRLIHGGSW